MTNSLDFVSAPVDIETFIKDPQYLGGVLCDGIYPYWLEQLKKIYEQPAVSQYNEILLAGALGAGRSLAAIVGFLYELYIVTLAKDPHKTWVLLPTTRIELAIITAGDNCNTLLADRILDCINLSPYFKSILLPNKGDALESDMFPNHIGITFKHRGFLGKAIFGAIVDDSCFPQEQPLCDKWLGAITELYVTIWRRSFARFGGMGRSRMWLAVSSDSPLYSLVEARRKYGEGGTGVFYVAPSIWEVQAFKKVYCGDTFSVFVGSDTEQPRIVTDIDDLVKHKDKIIQVPVEYHPDFEQGISTALQELGGIPLTSIHSQNRCNSQQREN